MRLLVVAKTSAGSVQEHVLPGVSLEDVVAARDVVESEHRKLGHHLNSDGVPRALQGFAGFVRECVPQSEARALLERVGVPRVPERVLALIKRGGLDSMIMLYALTLPRARTRQRLGGGVWLEAL